MASDLLRQALIEFAQMEYERAVALFTQAISFSPKDAELFFLRAQANLKLRNFTEAVADASRAIELDPPVSLKSKGYYCMGDAYYELEKYQTAKAAWELGSSLAPADARFTNLIKRCDERIAEVCGEIIDPPLVKASSQVVPVEGGRESGQISDGVLSKRSCPKARKKGVKGKSS